MTHPLREGPVLCGQGSLPEGGYLQNLLWPIAGEQEAGAAGHSPGPVVLGLVPTGKGNGGSTSHCPCQDRTVPRWRAGWVVGSPCGAHAGRAGPHLLLFPGGVGRMAWLCAGEEEKEGTARACGAGLPAAASAGGSHTPSAVRGWHEGLPAAAACPAADAGRPGLPLLMGSGQDLA